jgi:hypothetical protein
VLKRFTGDNQPMHFSAMSRMSSTTAATRKLISRFSICGYRNSVLRRDFVSVS